MDGALIEFEAKSLEFTGIEDMDEVNLYIVMEGGNIGRFVGRIRSYTEEEDPKKQLVRFEFVTVRSWLEEKLEAKNG